MASGLLASPAKTADLLLVVQAAVKLLLPVEAAALQGFSAGGAAHAPLVPQAVVQAQQEPLRDDASAAFAHRARPGGSPCNDPEGG